MDTIADVGSRAARNERECVEAPATRRFVIQTPIYDGPNDSVSFAENTITATAQGRLATDEAGNPEAWFDPVHPIKLSFTGIGGERTDVEGILPLHHAMVGGRHRVSIQRRAQRPRLRRGNSGGLRLPLSPPAQPCRRAWPGGGPRYRAAPRCG